MENEQHVTLPKRRSRRVRIAQLVVGSLLIWLVAAYLVVPFVWAVYARRHRTFDDKHLEGRNGGGDPWRTDGALDVGVIAEKTP